jgi:nucleoside-diphosphate-sugar epimerase
MQREDCVLVTGANGWIGHHLTMRASIVGWSVRGAVRLPVTASATGNVVPVGELDGNTDWLHALLNCRVVVHTAARVHMMHDKTSNPLREYRRVNVEGSLNLARQASKAGIKRFIFVSSIKVNGEQTLPNQPFHADDGPDPKDPYGISKMEAEQGLRDIARQTGMEVVIVRPPLVYGPNVKANFATLMRAVKRGVPLPLGAINNQRSLIGIDNLVDFLITCIDHPLAANETFLVSDGRDLSVPELVCELANAMGVKAHLLNIPVSALQFFATFMGKRDAVNRLCENLQMDIDKARQLLAWTPPVSIDEGLKRAVHGV